MTTVKPKIIVENIKRLYAEYHATKTCKCGHELICDLRDHYLSYPKEGSEQYFYFYCDYCDRDYEVPFKIGPANIEITYE